MNSPRSFTTGLFSMFFVRTAKLQSNMSIDVTNYKRKKCRYILERIECVLSELDSRSEITYQKTNR